MIFMEDLQVENSSIAIKVSVPDNLKGKKIHLQNNSTRIFLF